MREEWQDKQGVFERHRVEPPQQATIKELQREFERRERAKAIEIVEKFISILKEEYMDSDLDEVLPKVIDKFLLKYYPKL